MAKSSIRAPFTPVKASPKSGNVLRTIPIAGKLTLGRDMAGRAYTLEVIVPDATARSSSAGSGSTSKSGRRF
jgi:hypothetical protein